jgi:PAS domain S-box-containing protein
VSPSEKRKKRPEQPTEGAPVGISEPHRRLFEGAFEGIILVDEGTGIIKDCNQAFLDLTGWERSELIGRPFAPIHLQKQEPLPAGRDVRKHLAEGEGSAIELLIVAMSGTVKEVEVKTCPFGSDGSLMTLPFYRDVTAERTLLREKQTGLELLSVLGGDGSVPDLARNLSLFLHE